MRGAPSSVIYPGEAITIMARLGGGSRSRRGWDIAVAIAGSWEIEKLDQGLVAVVAVIVAHTPHS